MEDLESIISLVIYIVLPLTLIVLGYIVGSIAEKRHFKSLREREEKTLALPMVTFSKLLPDNESIASSKLVYGNVVVSIDYFKRFLAGLRNIFGGRIASYETLVDRGRREAILRMKAQALTADMIYNVRIETSSISKGDNKNSLGSVEVFAYGTAVKFAK